MTTPEIEPIKIKEYTVKQSKYPVVGKVPIRSNILGPSGSGKTVLSQNMILNALKTEYIYNTEYIQKHIKILTKTKYFKIGTEKNFQDKNWSNKIFCD